MNIYITYERTFFTEKQIKELEKYGKLIFLENYFDLDKAQYLEDSTEKILFADPELYKWNLRKEHISKIENLKAICINTTAPYSFYTKESINRLVDLWCNNTISILENKMQNVVGA